MSAPAAAQAPLSIEGSLFWEDLVAECKERVEGLNRLLSSRGFKEQDLVEFSAASALRIHKTVDPRMEIRVDINFRSWGPVLTGSVKGKGAGEMDFCAKEFEFPVSKDLDGSVVAIYDQGKSFSARDLSFYLMQNLRRCYPEIALPC